MDDCSMPKTSDVLAGPFPIETLGLFTALCDANWPIDAALATIEQKTAERRIPRTGNVMDLAAYKPRR
jgi:hypothetical protein